MQTTATIMPSGNGRNQTKRKHVKQMTNVELIAVINAIKGVYEWKVTDYFFNRAMQLNEFGYPMEDITNTIKHGEIIEVHNIVDGEIRVLLRYTPKDKEKSVCVVVSLTKKQAITAYLNLKGDKHYSLDWRQYQWETNLAEELNKVQQ